MLDHENLAAKIEEHGRLLSQARHVIGQTIIGQDSVIDLALTALLSGGHALLIGVPGLAKTRLVETLGVVIGLDAKRVQFTPDLLPSDILGAEVLEQSEDGKRHFRFIEGPVFTQLLMADEINRASPRTQSALLQAMQEKEVSIAGARHVLPKPFHVLATQNPIDQEGTYQLPEAQLDRFLLQIDVDYPDINAERAIILATTGAGETEPYPVITTEQLMEAQELVRVMPIGETVVDAILRVVRAARPNGAESAKVASQLNWGPGPRAGQALMLATRARALLRGDLAPSLEDVRALAYPALVHRMSLSYAARAEGVTPHQLVDQLLDDILPDEK